MRDLKNTDDLLKAFKELWKKVQELEERIEALDCIEEASDYDGPYVDEWFESYGNEEQ